MNLLPQTRPPKETTPITSAFLLMAAGLLLATSPLDAEQLNAPTVEPAACHLCPRGGRCPAPNIQIDAQNENFPISMNLNSVVRVVNSIALPLSSGNRRVDEKGSGSLIENSLGEQFVLTAAHIFRDGRGTISVYAQNGSSCAAQIVLIDSTWDIALLTCGNLKTEQTAVLAKTPALVGDITYAVGFGPNDRLAVTRGTVVGYSRITQNDSFETLKTTGAVRQGDSGGPVLNLNGELTGVIWGTDGKNSYATYSDRIRRILEQKSELNFKPDAETPDQPAIETYEQKTPTDVPLDKPAAEPPPKPNETANDKPTPQAEAKAPTQKETQPDENESAQRK